MKNLTLLFFLLVFIFSCKSDDETPIVLSDLKIIKSFTVSNIDADIDTDSKTIHLNLFDGADLTSITPDIDVSPKATVSPASGEAQDFTNPVTYTVTAEDNSTAEYTVTAIAECASTEHIHSFTFDGKNYEIIKLNRNWELAASCAVERGGYLAEINTSAENSAIFDEVIQNTDIDPTKTVASDGGLASYVWLGGNDTANEGQWIWDGDNDGTGGQFWEGDASGMALNNFIVLWGKEPDNFNDQDGLGLAITQWPLETGTLGNPGQWNDVKTNNGLYYVIEFD